jgi:anti-sigma factor RsiW
MACRNAARLISEGMDRPLTWVEKLSLHFHLLRCSACRRYQAQLRAMRDLLRSAASRLDEAANDAEEPLPLDAKERIRATLRGQA